MLFLLAGPSSRWRVAPFLFLKFGRLPQPKPRRATGWEHGRWWSVPASELPGNLETEGPVYIPNVPRCL